MILEVISDILLADDRVATLRVFATSADYHAILVFQCGTTVPVAFIIKPMCLLEAQDMARTACARFTAGTN